MHNVLLFHGRFVYSYAPNKKECRLDACYLTITFSQGRLLMEVNYMLAYGSAEASLRLLWRFGLLEHLLPFQVYKLLAWTYTSQILNILFCFGALS
jgi:tRNA nucleotidyltransferase/poly(A) polymerase